jgi:hypothetical protein
VRSASALVPSVVAERDLRQRLESSSALETLEMLTSIVRTYGLDPTWVITGIYDPSTHRIALEETAADTQVVVLRLLANESGGQVDEFRPDETTQ